MFLVQALIVSLLIEDNIFRFIDQLISIIWLQMVHDFILFSFQCNTNILTVNDV